MMCSTLKNFSYLLLTWLFSQVSSAKNAAYHITICSNDGNTLGNLFQGFLSYNVSDDEETRLSQYLSVQNKSQYDIFSYNLLALAGKTSAWASPFQKFFADGTFTIDKAENLFSIRDILLVQRNFYFVNTVCSVIPPRFDYARKMICKCHSGDSLASVRHVNLSAEFHHTTIDSSYKWCVNKPCSNIYGQPGACRALVNPFPRSCIVVPLSKHPSLVSAKTDSPTTTAELSEEARNIVTSLASYDLTIPLTPYNFSTTFTVTSFEIDKEMIPRIVLENFPGIEKRFAEMCALSINFLGYFISIMPKYLFNLVIGASIVVNSDELASSTVIRLIIFILSGVVVYRFLYSPYR